MSRKFIHFFCFFFLCCVLFSSCVQRQEGEGLDLRDRVKEIVLENGMTFLLLKRGQAPVFSAQIDVKVGSIEEESGESGLAHFFEHLAFKGTETIGTKDFSKEKPILDEILKIGTEIVERKKAKQDPKDYEPLVKRMEELQKEQAKYTVPNELLKIVQKNGGLNFNASTGNDFTSYYVSFPSHKMELWAYLESERLKNRIFREFFTEIDVVKEERRMRIDNSPEGRMFETFLKTAFQKNPYKILPIGLPEDIATSTPKKALDFYQRYYTPSRMVAVLVGDFNIVDAERIIRRYFSKLPKVQEMHKEFPKEVLDDSFPRMVTVFDDVSPRLYLGFYRPAYDDPDDIVLDVVKSVLCDGKTSRFYKRLILEEKKAASVSCSSAFPGVRLDNFFLILALPVHDVSVQDVEKIILDEIEKLAKTGPTQRELEIVKNQIDADLIYSLRENSGLASSLAFYEILTGDWRYIYDLQKRVHEISSEDVKRVVGKYFVKERKVSGYLERRQDGKK